jgi:hypothetical protein
VNAAGEISADVAVAKGKQGAPSYEVTAPTEEEPEAVETRSSVPDTRDFMLRARLVRFDVTDVWMPQGLIALIGLDRTAGRKSAPDDSAGMAIIK